MIRKSCKEMPQVNINLEAGPRMSTSVPINTYGTIQYVMNMYRKTFTLRFFHTLSLIPCHRLSIKHILVYHMQSKNMVPFNINE